VRAGAGGRHWAAAAAAALEGPWPASRTRAPAGFLAAAAGRCRAADRPQRGVLAVPCLHRPPLRPAERSAAADAAPAAAAGAAAAAQGQGQPPPLPPGLLRSCPPPSPAPALAAAPRRSSPASSKGRHQLTAPGPPHERARRRRAASPPRHELGLRQPSGLASNAPLQPPPRDVPLDAPTQHQPVAALRAAAWSTPFPHIRGLARGIRWHGSSRRQPRPPTCAAAGVPRVRRCTKRRRSKGAWSAGADVGDAIRAAMLLASCSSLLRLMAACCRTAGSGAGKRRGSSPMQEAGQNRGAQRRGRQHAATRADAAQPRTPILEALGAH
jgi:hypothetical protein